MLSRLGVHAVCALLLVPFITGIEQCPESDADGDGWSLPDDCDDADASVHPGALELCDDIDQDCDGSAVDCTKTFTFDSANDSSYFVVEQSGSCSNYGIANGVLSAYCPDNADIVYWLDWNLEGYSRVKISLDLFTTAWNDAGPRIGIDFGNGFSAWGATTGYAFHLADTYDSYDSLCSYPDTCPSIKRDATTQLDFENIQTYSGRAYSLDAVLDNSGEFFELVFDSGTASMTSADFSTRSGRVGLHCSEGQCDFDSLSVSVE